MSLEFTFKNINRIASSNVIREMIPIHSSRVFETVNECPLYGVRLLL